MVAHQGVVTRRHLLLLLLLLLAVLVVVRKVLPLPLLVTVRQGVLARSGCCCHRLWATLGVLLVVDREVLLRQRLQVVPVARQVLMVKVYMAQHGLVLQGFQMVQVAREVHVLLVVVRVVQQGLIGWTCCCRCRNRQLLMLVLVLVVLVRVVRRGVVGCRGCRRSQRRMVLMVQVVLGLLRVQLVRVVQQQGLLVVVVRRCCHGHGFPLRTPLVHDLLLQLP